MPFDKRALMRRSASAGWALVAALGLTTIAPAAHAHGGIPRTFGIVMDPDDSKQMLLRSDVWGVVHTTNGGDSWQWSCAEVYGGQTLSADHRPMIIAKKRTFVASEFSGLQMTDDFCNWTQAKDLGDELVEDVVASASDLFLVTSTGTDAGIRGEVWKSSDNGDTWKQAGKPLPTDFAGKSLGVAPSDPQRVYVVGRKLGPQSGTLQRSDDGGATWKEITVPTDKKDPPLRIAAIHPTRPDVVLVWVDSLEGYNQNSPDDIWGTGDGGKTWKLLFSSDGDLPGLALSPDGETLVVAGPLTGVQSAKLDDALANGSSAFEQVFTGQVWALEWTDDGLYAGNDNFTARGIPAYMLGVSQDGGHTFSPVMNICQIEYPACGASTQMDQKCNKLFNMESGFKSDFVDGPRCVKASDAGATAPPPADAGVTGKPDAGHSKSETESSGGCSAGALHGTDGRGAWLAALALAGIGARRRRGTRR